MTGLTALIAVSGCDARPPVADAMPAAATPVTARSAGASGSSMMAKIPTNAWLGRWVGPEGLFLEIAADGGAFSGRYRITNRYTLDDEGVVTGLADRDTIVFTRAGRQERIRAGTGTDTGLKWLAGRTDCLIVGAHEGYCRV